MALGERAERAVREGDDGGIAVVIGLDNGIEALATELGNQRLDAARGPAVADGLGASLVPADLDGIGAGGPDLLGQAGQQGGEERHRRRFEPERRRVLGEGVAVLWAADLTS